MHVSFQEAYKEYLKYSKTRLKESTYNEKVIKSNKYILSYFREINIYEIKLKDIIEWKEYIYSFNFKHNYNSYLYYQLCSIYEFFVKFYDINKNLPKIEGNFINHDPESTGAIWTIDEFKKFINIIEEKKFKLIFELLFFTGIRKGELLALTIDDIDFNNKTIDINKTITKNYKIQTPKTKSSYRKIIVPDSIINELYDYCKNNEDKFLFSVSLTTLKRKKDNYCKKAGVKQIKIHEFRHSHCCFLYQNKIEINDISKRLGHKDYTTTMNVYLKYLPNNEKRVSQLLNQYC